MSSYVGAYYQLNNKAILINMDTFTVDGNIRQLSSNVTDNELIPSNWLEHTQHRNKSDNFCVLPYNPRKIRLYLTQTTYLLVILPWLEQTTQYKEFLSQVLVNPSIIAITTEREHITNYTLKLLTS